MDAAFARVHGVGATSGDLRQWNGEKVDGAQSLVVQRVLHQAPMTSTLRSSTKLLSGAGQIKLQSVLLHWCYDLDGSCDMVSLMGVYIHAPTMMPHSYLR